MSIEALILGKLHQPAERRTSRVGRPFVTATVRAAVGEDAVFVRVTAFSETAQAALLALQGGDAVALAGTLTPGAWTDREGNARPNLSIVAGQVMTPYALRKKRAAVAVASEPPADDALPPWRPPQQPATDDADDFGDAGPWLEGGAA